MNKIKTIGAVLAGVAVTLLLTLFATVLGSGAAHADPTTNYFSCLNDNGYTITNVTLATEVGRRIQNDEMANIPRGQIVANLENYWGIDPHKANVYIDCAYQALLNG